jgi:hypothetical protein
MLNLAEFLRSLTPKDKADDVGELEAAIGRLEVERASAKAELATIAERRPSLLLADLDKDLDADERASERAYRTVEKVDLVLPGLRDRLSAARDEARRAEWRGMLESHMASEVDHLANARAFLATHNRLVQSRAKAMERGFASEAAAWMPATPVVITRDTVDLFAAELARQRDAAAPKPPQARPAAPPPAPKPIVTDSAKPVPVKAAAPKPAPKPAPAPEPFMPTPGPDGLIRVWFRTPGHPLPDGSLSKLNDVIALPPEVARKVVEQKHGEYEEALR